MNKKKLLEKMSEKGISIQEMCAKLNMSRSAFYRKSNGISEFTQGEIQNIVEILKLESPMGIFSARKCPKGHNWRR